MMNFMTIYGFMTFYDFYVKFQGRANHEVQTVN